MALSSLSGRVPLGNKRTGYCSKRVAVASATVKLKCPVSLALSLYTHTHTHTHTRAPTPLTLRTSRPALWLRRSGGDTDDGARGRVATMTTMARQTEALQPHTAAAAARVAEEMAGDTGAATAAMALQMYVQRHQRSRSTAQGG